MNGTNETTRPGHRWRLERRRAPRVIAVAAVAAVLAVVATAVPAVGAAPSGSLPGEGRSDRFRWVSSDAPGWWTVVRPPVVGPDPGVVLSSDVSFQRGSAVLVDVAGVDAALGPLVAAFLGGSATSLVVDAYASADGREQANLELSLRRGEAARERLVAVGVPVERITVVAHGEADLPQPSDPEGAANRVVVVRPTAGG